MNRTQAKHLDATYEFIVFPFILMVVDSAVKYWRHENYA